MPVDGLAADAELLNEAGSSQFFTSLKFFKNFLFHVNFMSTYLICYVNLMSIYDNFMSTSTRQASQATFGCPNR